MEGTAHSFERPIDFGDFVDDRAMEKIFRVDRSIYTDPEVFDAEMERIFERSWIFLCHESQIAAHGDYFSTHIGRQPVYVIRQRDGTIGGFINACAHRAAILTPYQRGNAKTITCRFHGWSYNSEGRCLGIKNEKAGFPDPAFDRGHYNLCRVPKIASYQGFVFGSLSADVPSLEDHLGATKRWIDLMAVQSTAGLEVVPGTSTYAIGGNWKMQAENAVDGYHVSTVHRVFAATMSAREGRDGYSGMQKTEAGRIVSNVPTGSYDLGNGHMAIWAQHTTPNVRPIWEQKERLERDLPPAWVDWILNRGRNLYIFPNVMLMDNPSTQIRVMRPLAADRTDVTVYCIAPKGESAKARTARLRKFEDFYLTAGMATSDDISALEGTNEGARARYVRWNDMHRGIATVRAGADEDAKNLGFEPASSADNWDHEALFHGFYRHWRDLMTNAKTSAAP